MPTVSTPLLEEAQTIFARLGYSVSGDESGFIAKRKWRSVHVTAFCSDTALNERHARTDGGTISDQYQLRCFVTPEAKTTWLKEELTTSDPNYEWAIIGVESDEDGGWNTNEYDVILSDAD
ncbi:hypothetical protein [Haloquadratum walsbyi]|jgi:hypothetical protein|uniref:Uncharacterized protein n=1 Tax=Haloquadratum walsbyi J07HQW2 TaxID=1238425 RepID=U1PMH9_9EURY|nr:hypothetical protein [Haloquadratum walsbyi]ERG94932.1 MAG: hypothetical protein J07HQW2_01374 [Haloquadratum walsbyi J07HQW2]